MPPVPLSRLRLVGRISVRFLLDLVRIGRMGRDLTDSLILIGVIQSNIDVLNRDQDLARTYAGYDDLPPDDLRRRVSVSALSQSLRLPYETVRRRIAALAAQGECVVTPQGVYVPAEALNTPAHHTMILESYARVRELYFHLRALDMLDDLPRADAAPMESEPVRAVGRASADYVLRIMDLVARHMGDIVHGLIVLTVLRCNTDHFPDEMRGGEEEGAAHFIADHLRRPVRISTLSERLGVPEETVRRHCTRLVADDHIERLPEGLIVPSRVLARPHLVKMMADNQAYVRRMFEPVARLGIAAAWERDGQTA